MEKAEQFLLKYKDKDPMFKDCEAKYLVPIRTLKDKCKKMIEFMKHNSHKVTKKNNKWWLNDEIKLNLFTCYKTFQQLTFSTLSHLEMLLKILQ